MMTRPEVLEMMEEYVELLKPAYPDITLDRTQVCVRYTVEGETVEEGYSEIMAAYDGMSRDLDMEDDE